MDPIPQGWRVVVRLRDQAPRHAFPFVTRRQQEGVHKRRIGLTDNEWVGISPP